jgi:hypothetical protein
MAADKAAGQDDGDQYDRAGAVNMTNDDFRDAVKIVALAHFLEQRGDGDRAWAEALNDLKRKGHKLADDKAVSRYRLETKFPADDLIVMLEGGEVILRDHLDYIYANDMFYNDLRRSAKIQSDLYSQELFNRAYDRELFLMYSGLLLLAFGLPILSYLLQ